MTTLPEITAADLRDPLASLTRLDEPGVRRWLRATLRVGRPLPFRAPRSAALAPALAQALSGAPDAVLDPVREAVPTLVAE